MYEITFGSRKFCGFLKFRPDLQKFITFKIWKAPFEREYFAFRHSGKLMLFLLTFCVFSRSCSRFVLFFPQSMQSLCPRNIWFWLIDKSKLFMKREIFCHSQKFIPKISQSFHKNFCQRKFLPLCPKVLIFFRFICF